MPTAPEQNCRQDFEMQKGLSPRGREYMSHAWFMVVKSGLCEAYHTWMPKL